jgi:integrase
MVDEARLPVPATSSSSSNEGEKSVVAPATTDVLARAASYAEASASPATRRAYASDLRDFAAWCAGNGACPRPADPLDVARYLAALADGGLKASTIARRTAAIGYAHASANLPNPASSKPVRAVLSGIRRRIGTAVERKAPITARTLNLLFKRVPDTLRGKRDRALLALGFAAALRRSELVGIDVADLERVDGGLFVHLGKTKTDQEGKSLPSRGRGSKPRRGALHHEAQGRRSLHGGADRNTETKVGAATVTPVAPFTGARIEAMCD